jgi:hypothetical protein
MDACLYASHLRDEEWALLEPLVPRSHPASNFRNPFVVF